VSTLPVAARAWVNTAIGPDELVVAARDLPGATSSALYDLTTMTRLGAKRHLVLRWYPDDAVFVDEPQAIEREAAALDALAGTDVPAPRLVGVLPRDVAPPAAILMTHLAGSASFELADPEAVRDVLEAIHAVDPSPLAGYRYAGYHEGFELIRPPWWRDTATWDRAVTRTLTARPTGQDRFIHRDFHPGNLLWLGPRLTGVVDWVNACVGPVGIDVAHCRLNLAILWGPERADAILAGDPAWDIEAAFSGFDWSVPGANDDWPGGTPDALAALGAPVAAPQVARDRFEAFVARALADLG
jgi:aminoglycoside phosphotransferase (APT) family kinase protein